MTLPANLMRAVESARALNRPRAEGKVRSIRGIAIHVTGLAAAIGDTCTIHADQGRLPIPAEVVGFNGDDAVVMALGDAHRVAPWDQVHNDHRPLSVPVGAGLLGRVVDALGRPLDGGPEILGRMMPLNGVAPSPLPKSTRSLPPAPGWMKSSSASPKSRSLPPSPYNWSWPEPGSSAFVPKSPYK